MEKMKFQCALMLLQNYGKKNFLSALAGKTKMTMMMMKIKKVKNQAKPPPQSKLKTYKEAISSLEDVQLFLENQGHVEESMQLGTLVDKLTIARISTMKQKTLHEFI